MKKIVVENFGEPHVLQLREVDTPEPGAGQVRVALKSVGMNHADLMARRGEYKISSGPLPFTPGIEGGGVIDAVGPGVTDRAVGQRVILGADAPRPNSGDGAELWGGTYKTHYIVPAHQTVPAPASLPDEQLGAIWLSYLTAWGCLIWKQGLKPGQFVGIPAASSGVAMAAAQIVKAHGAIPIGLTSTPSKVEQLQAMPEAAYDHYVVTHNADRTMRPWHRDLRRITQRHGVDVFFDPVASGEYLDREINSLAEEGTLWVYGLLGEVGPVDVTPLIRKMAAIRGWVLYELVKAGPAALQLGYDHILDGFDKGRYRQRIDKTFRFDQIQEAHQEMETGKHIGKLVLLPH
jgi:NADPH:quinone reductase-like Zn-dependent oxidoreductase